MNRQVLNIVSAVGLAALATAGSLPPAYAECVPWKSAGKVISENGLVPGNVVYKKVQSKTGGEVISASLCQNGNKYVYQVTVLGKKGDVKKLKVDARTGNF